MTHKNPTLETTREQLEAERVTITRRLTFCADDRTRAGLEQRRRELDRELADFGGLARLKALRNRQLQQLGMAGIARRPQINAR